ncbi:acyl-CoA thioesterase [Pueribacillus theae]|uniref:Acyl-CoA thioesterase n=1 Tax=Pueribacillus theae TaxID=2171751 RepID=A0A2U1K1P9_9BACI|nr:acyl-CoA thioesterase [Pueribacillus theae]PWA11114.1 acyl-CoA thioesterase [Pueribacillus theae]
METTTEIIVKEEDIDELEHVNNSVYVTYLEKGRGDWYREAGFSFEEMKKHQYGTVVVKLNITFIKEAKLRDRLKIKTIPIRLGNTSFDHKQEIYNEQGDMITEAFVTNVMFDRKERKSIPVVKELARHFNNE